jgi:hypothetical protein
METIHHSSVYEAIRTSMRAMRRGNVTLTILLAFVVTPPATSMAEDEPNDTLYTATTTGLSGLGSVTITGVMLGNGDWADRDVDLYSFEINELTPRPVRLIVEVQSKTSELDAFVRLFGVDPAVQGNGVEVANNDDRAFTDVDPRLGTYLLESGMYFLGVSASSNPHYDVNAAGSGREGTGGAYTLTITTEPAALPDSPFEPNDLIWIATFMGTESFEVKGEFIGDGEHGRRDVDIYAFRLTGPARLDVEVRAEAIGSVLDPVVRLRNCEDEISERTYVDACLLGANDDSPRGSVDAAVSVGVVAAQDVYIMVSGAGNRRYDPSVSGLGEIGSVGFYDLTVNVTYFSGVGPNEPNDSISLATHVGPFVTGRPEIVEVEGFVGDGRYSQLQGDRDFYLVTLIDKPRLLTIDVAAASIGSTLDPVIAIYDVEGRRIAVNDNHGDSTDAHIALPVSCVPVSEDAASVYVMVMGTKQRFPADPFKPMSDTTVVGQLAIRDGPGSVGAYRITFGAAPSEVSCVNEPDNTLTTATNTSLIDEGYYFCTHGEIGDSLCPDAWDDVDTWSLEVVHAPASLEVTVPTCRFDGMDCYVIDLFDAKGKQLALLDTGFGGFEVGTLRVLLDEAGTYYVAVSGRKILEPDEPDPTKPCSTRGLCTGTYDLMIALTPGRHSGGVGSSGEAGTTDTGTERQLFVTRLDEASNQIDVIDPDSAQVTASFPAPEPRFGGSEGLAYDGSNLYYVGVGRYPKLYQLDANTGDVLDEYILWSGSGYYSDAVMLGGELFLLDFRDRTVHVIDPGNQRFIRTLRIGSINGITIGGGLAALAGPNRLYVADAFNTRDVYEVDPLFGVAKRTLSPVTSRPTAIGGIGTSTLYVADWQSAIVEIIDRDGTSVGELSLVARSSSFAGHAWIGFFADFDGDGDIDLADYGSFQRCFTGSDTGVEPGCEPGDRNRDRRINLFDFAVFPEAATGP